MRCRMTASVRGNSNSGASHTAPFGDVHAPRSETRLFLAQHEQRMSRLIEGRAGEFVTASAHLALNFRFARLVTCRAQTQMRADIPRATRAVRLIDRGTKGERGDGSDT